MTREPPRLHGDAAGNFYSDVTDDPFDLPPISPRSSGLGKKLLLGFGIAFVLTCLACAGLFGWLYTSFNTASQMTADYREQREPQGGGMSEPIKVVLSDALPKSSDEVAELQPLLESLEESYDVAAGDELVDHARVVQEMQRSGMAVGVNALTRYMWVENIRGAVGLPDLGDRSVVLELEWLKPDSEARVTIVSYTDWDAQPDVWLLYVIRGADGWRVYDCRDVLSPLSESQYLAAFAAAPVGVDDNYAVLGERLSESYYGPGSVSEKAQQALVEFERLRYAKHMQALAECLVVDYLLLYEDEDALAAFLPRLQASSFARVHLARGRLAMLQGERQRAFEHAASLMAAVGWHPAAALLAGEAAESPQDRQQAAEWLGRSVLLCPEHGLSVEAYFEVADDAQLNAWLAQLDAWSGGAAVLERLANSVPEKDLARLAEAVQQFDTLAVAGDWLGLVAASKAGNEEAVIERAGQLLASTAFLEHAAQQQATSAESQGLVDRVWNHLLDAAVDQPRWELALQVVPERLELARRFRDRLLNTWYYQAAWEPGLELLSALPADSSLAQETETQIAIGLCQFQVHDYQAAIGQLLPIVEAQRDQLLSHSEPPAHAYRLMEAVAASAVETDQMMRLVDTIDDPETAFVIVSAALDTSEQAPHLERLLQWYSAQPNTPQMWAGYRQAELAYAHGAWEDADAALRQAIEEATADERFENLDFSSIVYDFAPISEELYEWFELRVVMAYRCGRLADLLRQELASGALDEDYGYAIPWLLRGCQDASLLREIASLMVDGQLAAGQSTVLRQAAHELRSVAYQLEANSTAAIDELMTAAHAADADEESYGHDYLQQAARLMASSGELGRIGEIEDLAQDQDGRALATALQALATGNRDQFIGALDAYESSYRKTAWQNDVPLLTAVQRAGFGAAVNQQFALEVQTLSYDYRACGLILLSENPSELRMEIEAALQTVAGQPWTDIDLARFPDACAGWWTDSQHGRWVAVAYDQILADSDAETLKRLQSGYQGLLCLVWLPDVATPTPFVDLRNAAAELGRQMPAAVGFVDYLMDSWFTSDEGAAEEWTDRLQQASSHGVNRLRPRAEYLPWSAAGTLPANDPLERRVRVGWIVEQLEVEPADASDAEGTVARIEPYEEAGMILQAPVVLLPLLETGTRIQ